MLFFVHYFYTASLQCVSKNIKSVSSCIKYVSQLSHIMHIVFQFCQIVYKIQKNILMF